MDAEEEDAQQKIIFSIHDQAVTRIEKSGIDLRK